MRAQLGAPLADQHLHSPHSKACFYFVLGLNCEEFIRPIAGRYDWNPDSGSHNCVPSANSHIRCIRVLATEIFKKILVASTQTQSRGDETRLNSGWTLIGSELCSLNFNTSVRAE